MAEEIGMLKKFRLRFILMTMLMVGVVAFVVLAAIDVANYRTIQREIETTLARNVQFALSNIPSSNDSSDSDESSENSENGKNGNDGSDKSSAADNASNRGKYRHTIDSYAIWVTSASPLTYSVLYNSFDLDTTTLDGAVAEALENATSGEGMDDIQELSGYDLYYKVGISQFGTVMVAFVPKSAMWEDLGEDSLVLAGAWLLLMIAVFAITYFMSRYVARPVEKAWRDQQRFIADASHELKTPLTVIMADVSILKDSPEKTVREQSNWVEGISNEAERMKQLTEDLLTLAQADAGVDMKQIMGEVDFSSVVEGQVLQFDAVAFERGLVIEDEVQESLHVTGDQMRLENMVKTLLENACKYARQPGSIGVRLQQEKNEAVLSIHNDGDPIPAEDLPHLFDRFYRSDKARTHEGEAASFGLGLSIAKSTAELHGGSIGVRSGEDGTTFTVRIPLSKDPK